MEFLLTPVAVRVLSGILLALLAFLIWFSVDIYMLWTKKDFGKVNFYLVYFTRNDYESRSDALHFRNVGSKISLMRDVYRNRVLFWRVILASRKATVNNPVLHFGNQENADIFLLPLRAWFVSNRCAVAEIKRAAGLPFREKKYFLALVYDRSEDRRSYVLKVVLVQHDDLCRSHQYLVNPPKVGSNRDLWYKIVHAYYEEGVGGFVPVQVVAA